MRPAMLIYSVTYFILIQIISGHIEFVRKNFFLKSYNTTYSAKSWRSETDRSKRSIYSEVPRSLKMAIQYEGLLATISSNLIKQLPFLANKYLPVIGDQVNPQNVMNDVGEFVMYYDVKNCIAVVYFHKFGTLHGVIGLNHHIIDLPFHFDEDGNYLSGLAKRPYVEENHHQFLHINPQEHYPPPSDIDAWEDFLQPSNCPPDKFQRLYTCELQPSTSRQHREQNIRKYLDCTRKIPMETPLYFGSWVSRQHYIETLVLVTRDLADLFKANFGEEEYVAAIVRYHIIYFNAVNMLLRRLGMVQIEYYVVTINIAKIVIEGVSTSFDFEGNDELQFTDVTTKLPIFFRNHSDLYPQDSFDYVFVHTNRSIIDENVMVDGISKYRQDMMEGRKNGKFYETIPITVAKLTKFYANYAVTAHEIGQILGLKIVPKENGLCFNGQCHSIMQRNGPKCNTCLTWTDEDYYEFLTFFRKNKNRCFFINKPRSLHPLIVINLITPHQQCQCLGYDSYNRIYKNKVQSDVRIYGCSVPLKCQNMNSQNVFLNHKMLPFDGTPCSKNKICWNGKCRLTGSARI